MDVIAVRESSTMKDIKVHEGDGFYFVKLRGIAG
jgi:hypothetical protein